MIVLSSSAIHSLISCPRKFILNYCTPNRQKYLTTEVGTAVHQALQAGTETGSEHEALKALVRRYPYELFLNATKRERANRSLLSCAVAVDNTLQRLNFKNMKLVEINGRKASELDFLLTIDNNGNKDIAYSGSIDSIFIDASGRIFITDYKTTSKDAQLETLHYQKSMQAVIYAIVVAAALGIPATDVYYQYIIVKLDDQLGETVFEQRRISEESISDAKHFLKTYCNILLGCMSDKYFPPNASSCTAFNKACYHADKCSNRGVEEALREIAMTQQGYRYAYLDTGKTDYDIKGEITLC